MTAFDSLSLFEVGAHSLQGRSDGHQQSETLDGFVHAALVEQGNRPQSLAVQHAVINRQNLFGMGDRLLRFAERAAEQSQAREAGRIVGLDFQRAIELDPRRDIIVLAA